MHKNVLLIEDDFELVEPITAFLQNEGYHITSANKGRNALKLFNVIPADIVILDFSIADMDALDVIFQLLKVRNESEFFIIPVFENKERYYRGSKNILNELSNVTKPLIEPFNETDFENILNNAIETLLKREFIVH